MMLYGRADVADDPVRVGDGDDVGGVLHQQPEPFLLPPDPAQQRVVGPERDQLAAEHEHREGHRDQVDEQVVPVLVDGGRDHEGVDRGHGDVRHQAEPARRPVGRAARTVHDLHPGAGRGRVRRQRQHQQQRRRHGVQRREEADGRAQAADQ
jgi:hypothetical protein